MTRKAKCSSLLILLLTPLTVLAAPPCAQPAAKIVSLQGKASRQSPGDPTWQEARQDDSFCPGDSLHTEKWSRATLVLSNQSLITLDQGSTLIFSEPQHESTPWLLKLLQGVSYFRSRQPQHLNVQTPFVNAVHEGTEFLITVDNRQAHIAVFDGQVAATNAAGRIQINKGQVGSAASNQPPRLQTLTVTPADAVQWALYYPPLIDFEHYAADPLLTSALDAYRRGDIVQALAKLEGAEATPDALVLRASLLLTVGRVDEATAAIEQGLRLRHEPSTLHALQAIVAVAKNQQDAALALARQAEAEKPKSAVAKTALSYAYQALFKIEDAQAAALQATELAPQDALAWARLAELQLSTGHREEALASAQTAARLNPRLARTQTILGFADLARIDVKAARQAFEQALRLDSSDPTARLGLGLAKIRKGALEEGTRELETAVNLDPNNAVGRSYLGKAYYELRNKDYAGTELNLAKEMDPKDPTPWFYDAILKQTINRPIAALHDMQNAIALNDNRGVYRSKLLLDSDSAARSASLGRIYNDLGFQQRGLLEGWTSINEDPSNYSAHRLLADNYAALPRHEIARLSELLKAQLLQPINVTPVQPQTAESNILILDGLGASIPSFNEYNPLFTRDRFALQTSGFYGSHDTLSDEVVHSGVWDRFSYSLGQFHYQSDGYRTNNDQRKDAYNVFAQAQVTKDTHIQLELRRVEEDFGDLNQGFYSDNTDKKPSDLGLRFANLIDLARAGFHHQFAENSDLLFSFVHKHEDISQAKPLLAYEASYQTEGTQYELQHIYKHKYFDLSVGMDYLSNQTGKYSETFAATRADYQLNSDSEHKAFYAYSNIKPIEALIMTVGFSQDFYHQESLPATITFSPFAPAVSNQNPANPKFGLTWLPTKDTTLRFAAFRSLRRGIIQKQTLEPTQIAGFNQFFDDLDGTLSNRIGFGVDHKFGQKLFTGAEISRRELDVPFLVVETTGRNIDKTNWSEENLRAYVNWTPNDFFSMGANYSYEALNRNNTYFDNLKNNSNYFTELKTHRPQIFANFYHPSGFISKLSLTYVNQAGNFFVQSLDKEQRDASQFWLLDGEIGYRLPKRHGLVSAGIKNLLDEKFNFQGIDVNQPALPQGRFLYSRLTFSF